MNAQSLGPPDNPGEKAKLANIYREDIGNTVMREDGCPYLREKNEKKMLTQSMSENDWSTKTLFD